jgi:hypothetical protein
MNRLVMTCAAVSTVLLAACGGGEVVVQAQLQGVDGQPVALRNLPVRAIPYDRDALFDSLGTAYGTPEPEIPADLLTLQDSIARAQEEWRVAETRWQVGRDSLQRLNQRLQGMSRASGEYMVLFREFDALDAQVRGSENQSRQAFQRFTNLQNRFATRAQEVSQQRDQWADAAYADFDRVVAARARETRRSERADTTNENGIARIRGLDTGQWWIHARYELPFEELYWNIPVNASGEQVQLQLTRETAQVRPKLR